MEGWRGADGSPVREDCVESLEEEVMSDKRVESMQIDVDEILRLRREYEEAVRLLRELVDDGDDLVACLNGEKTTHERFFISDWETRKLEVSEFLDKREEG